MALAALPGVAQTVVDTAIGKVPDGDTAQFGFREGSIVAVPIPFSNPTLGNGLTLGGGYLFQDDAGSGTSFLGIGGFRSDNGSQGLGFGGNLSLNNGRWNASLFLGTVDLRYDLFLFGRPLPLRQDGTAALGEFTYGFTPEIAMGVSVRYLETTVSLDGLGRLSSEVLPDADLALATAGLVLDWDRRDSDIYPTRGTFLEADLTHTEALEGRDRSYQKGVLAFSAFAPLGAQGVIGGRAVLCGVTDEAPFYDACSLGATDGFRGYESTRFIGDRMASAQAEYRGRLSDRFGYAAFAGLGQVEREVSFQDSELAYAGGVGLRYRVAREFGLDLSLDVSVNRDGETLYYLYVGQGF